MKWRVRVRDLGRDELNPTGGYIYTGRTFWFYNGRDNPMSWQYMSYPSAGPLLGHEVCIDDTNAGPPYKTGGPFTLGRWSQDKRSIFGNGTLMGKNGWRYEGGFYFGSPYWTANDFASLFSDSPNRDIIASESGVEDALSDAYSLGATGWNRARPGRPSAELGVALAEIRELPRMLKTTALAFKRGTKSLSNRAADQWLNSQFGWKPFLGDIRDMISTYFSMENQLRFLRNHNGKWLHRSCTLNNQTELECNEETGRTHIFPTLTSNFYDAWTADDWWIKTETSVSDRQWFEGRFRYYIPNINSVYWERNAVRKLYGINLTPSLVWELVPWSWLIDWFSNVGDVISNLDNNLADNLVAQYAYVMETKEWEATITSGCNFLGGPISATWRQCCTSKARAAASPFGFGLSSEAFTGRQWSILSALGISRLS